MNTPKISEVTKALKAAGFTAISVDEPNADKTYYKHKGALYINAGRVGFGIESAKNARIFGKYHTSAIDSDGGAHEAATDCPEFFFPRLFGYLSGDVSEAQIISGICN